MNIEIVKYKSTQDSKVLYAYVSGIDSIAEIPSVELQQYGSDSVIVPIGSITKQDISPTEAFIAIDITSEEINKSSLFLVKLTIGLETAEYPVYDSNDITIAKIDMINIVSKREINDDFLKYYTLFLFFESGIRDMAKYSDIIECNKFYVALKELVRAFKTKYYYNEKTQ